MVGGSRELVMPQLHEKGLIASINTIIDDIHLSTKIKIKFIHDQENELLSQGKKVTLYRIVQEQMKNILKHSKASDVEITLQSNEQNLQLSIQDNGTGFNPNQARQGIGLSNIYERTRFYNGTVEIQTAKSKGCMIKITIPFYS